jgi:hypothetical protein
LCPCSRTGRSGHLAYQEFDDDDDCGTTSGMLFADIHAQYGAKQIIFTMQKKIIPRKYKQTNKGT